MVLTITLLTLLARECMNPAKRSNLAPWILEPWNLSELVLKLFEVRCSCFCLKWFRSIQSQKWMHSSIFPSYIWLTSLLFSFSFVSHFLHLRQSADQWLCMAEWYAFIGRRAGLGVPGSPYAINFLPTAPESSGMKPMNATTYSCGDTSLGCSCGDCPSSAVCSSSALPAPPKKGSCSVRIGSLNVRKFSLDAYGIQRFLHCNVNHSNIMWCASHCW